MPSFTQRIQNLQQIGPVVEILLTPSVPYMQSMGINIATIKDRVVKVLAMIDTGATGTVISKGITEKLGINPVGTILINTPSHTDVSCYQFDAQIVFPNNVAIPSIVVTEAPLQGQHIQCLIGRDVLQHSVFIYTGYDNSFTLSFSVHLFPYFLVIIFFCNSNQNPVTFRRYQQTKRLATDAQPPHRFAFLCVLLFALSLRAIPRYACDFERGDV